MVVNPLSRERLSDNKMRVKPPSPRLPGTPFSLSNPLTEGALRCLRTVGRWILSVGEFIAVLRLLDFSPLPSIGIALVRPRRIA